MMGVGRDTFVFTADGSLDKIKDFQHGIDLIDISGFDVASIDVLLAGAKERGGDVIKLDDLTLASLSSSDFII
jgi:Ca2+-binding RTX toxin-like protein